MSETQPRTPPRLGHVHLKVSSLERSLRFYQDLFQLQLKERVGDRFAFLSSSQAHHDIALQALGDRASRPAPGATGLYHVAFELPSRADLDDFAHELDRQGIRFQAVDHGISQALYFDDPDGNGLEVFVDRRASVREHWGGVTERLEEPSSSRVAQGGG